MSEKTPKFESRPAHEAPAEYVLTAEQLAHAEFEMKRHSSEPLQLSPEGCAEKIAELEGLYATFEQNHDLEALGAITEFEGTDVREHPVREPARQDFKPIMAIVRILQKQDAVSDEVFFKILDNLQHADQAIGVVNNGRIDHSRTFARTRRKE